MCSAPANCSMATSSNVSAQQAQTKAPFCRVLPEMLFGAFVILFTTIRLIEEHTAFLQAPGADWNSSEWMINYAAGFVRRGLGGELVARLMHLTGAGFFLIWATLTTTIYLALCWYQLHRCCQRGGSWLWRFCLLLNPALLIFPLECGPFGSFLRKEVLFVAATALLVSLYESTLQRNTTPRLFALFPVLLTSCLISILLALLHEGMFLFGWFPLNFGVLAAFLRSRVNLKSALPIAFVVMFPALAITAASSHWHGNAQMAQAICQSWHANSVPTLCTAGNLFPPAVDALSWSVKDATWLAWKSAWRFPFFLAIVAFVAALSISAIHHLVPGAKPEHLIALIVLPLLTSFPIFVLGWDWGRYLFMVMEQEVFVMLSDKLRPSLFDVLPVALRNAFAQLSGAYLQKRLSAFALWVERVPLVVCFILLVLPVPCVPPERTMFTASPPVILFSFMHQIWEKR